MTGHVRLPAASHFSMLGRSYVWPVDKVTGSVNKSRLIGHLNRWGITISASFIEKSRFKLRIQEMGTGEVVCRKTNVICKPISGN